MNKYRVAFVSVLMLLGTSAIAADWNSSFGAVDTDGNGSINRAEFTANEGKLDPTMNPTFTMMDKDGSNSVDQDEWAGAAKQ
jgi:Ca2+-binding EF-hand superfamily protein